MEAARRIAGIVLAAAGIAGIVLAAWLVAPSLLGPHETFQEYMLEDPAAVEAGEEAGGPAIDWDALLSANPDVVGWVRVEGSAIDCPVVQAPESDPEFYLSHSLDGSPSVAGCPYVDASSSDHGLLDFAPYVFGHSLVDSTMFSDFQRMGEASWAAEHSAIDLMTPAWSKRLEVCVVEVVDADVADKVTGIASGDEAAVELARAASGAAVVLEVPDRVERVWRFVTCSYQTDNSRTVVYAVEAR